MVEAVSTHKRPLDFQKRLDWYQFDFCLKAISRSAADLDLNPQDMVHIGGTAFFGRCYDAFGPRAVVHFRGTHDIDLLSFTPGSTQRVFDNLIGSEDKCVIGYNVNSSNSLSNKRTIHVELARGNNPGFCVGKAKGYDGSCRIEVDVFEPGNGRIHYNNRTLLGDRLIFDPPEFLDLPPHRGQMAVPSLRDCFIMKMDVVDFSQSGLRPKDIFDILVAVNISDKLNIDFRDAVQSLIEDIHIRQVKIFQERDDLSSAQQGKMIKELDRSLIRKLLWLEYTLSNPDCVRKHLPEDYPFLPNDGRINFALEVVQKAKKDVGVSGITLRG